MELLNPSLQISWRPYAPGKLRPKSDRNLDRYTERSQYPAFKEDGYQARPVPSFKSYDGPKTNVATYIETIKDPDLLAGSIHSNISVLNKRGVCTLDHMRGS